MSSISTHVLDTARGRPAAQVHVILDRRGENGEWHRVGGSETDDDGRLREVASPEATSTPGWYRLVFSTGEYFERHGLTTLYPQVVIVFETRDGEAHYHVPLLVAPFGYTTYRGS